MDVIIIYLCYNKIVRMQKEEVYYEKDILYVINFMSGIGGSLTVEY